MTQIRRNIKYLGIAMTAMLTLITLGCSGATTPKKNAASSLKPDADSRYVAALAGLILNNKVTLKERTTLHIIDMGKGGQFPYDEFRNFGFGKIVFISKEDAQRDSRVKAKAIKRGIVIRFADLGTNDVEVTYLFEDQMWYFEVNLAKSDSGKWRAHTVEWKGGT